MAGLADCFPRGFFPEKPVPGFCSQGRRSLLLCAPREGSSNDPCLVFVQDLMVAALLKYPCESSRKCDLNSVKNSGHPSWLDGLPSLVFAELCLMFRLWHYRVNKLLALVTNTLGLKE